ncbi:hypothetical protein ANOM_008248 [Aspergillus nomiae NRRL 13137]|uniref:Zn(2)-C6 fungal-type domain-containing protein n=1 Tax=Aspergillus nomiae NRRL (strain ATCC 15546 / NRRL 13137 / CBS 260.88 / M93) TaxID=1509407 RepID=A0A0L1IUD5_ASPN3|nr:uncharacterized protein ANOM_008248 [Aspergillus nomiae NRRL 13137]KNG83020.1 hypothetical protein ANOM_008248 [Aspergillus nomiae NRRL 13137]
MDSPSAPRSSEGRRAPRSRSGCWTCRTKKVKCDEGRPQCRRCLRLKLLCDYTPRRKAFQIGRQIVQSQRRRPAADTAGTDTAPQTSPTRDWFQSFLRQDEARSISTFRMPVPATSTSSVALTASDHEAIRYFRTTFAKLHHTKNPDYSLYSIMFKVAEVNPVVMHMVLAVGGREMEFQRNLQSGHELLGRGAGSPLWHYSHALKLMAKVIGNESSNRFNFDSIYTALYLMLFYEQKYGDDQCAGLVHHLNGAAQILKQQYSDQMSLLPPVARAHQPWALSSHAHRLAPNRHLSLYAARLLMWMVNFDTSAASYGLDSQLHATLYELMSTTTLDGQAGHYSQPLEKFEQLHHYSSPLYRIVWGDGYPQTELLDDVENRNVFFLEGACVQLRFMVAQLAKFQDGRTEAATRWASDTELSIENTRNKFCDLIEVAAGLSASTDNSHRLVANLRRVVPLFYAVLIYFLRVRSGLSQSRTPQQVDSLRHIMNLAFQAHKYDGEKAMVRIAWPLFMVALETNDHLHREWVLSRFRAIRQFGLNFERAYQFLVHVVDVQSKLGERVEVRGISPSRDFGLFVL